ncbi:AAA family ATPase [Enterococcus sp. 669A]|uniref:AAA family ATPase n=1 Tax=Candidatus Enterococcus moelleringii TaxID=2815325 RepID=A0ABS3LAI0_9ENTE|nr:AAA family ATPase [Enterococcus sp. 669A]MBO1306642.1 AAA family ATPase [Enterococcus sp. 669A]
MWIKKAEITGFGKWRQQTFLFEPKNQLVYGLNEAGKSTLYQFIQAILFGFPNKRKKGQDYTPEDGSGYGGRLTLMTEKYGQITVERYKSKNKGKAAVLLADGQQGDEALLETILYPLNQELFQQVFTFQQEQLQQLEYLQEDAMHDALVSLGLSGSNQLFEKKNTLQKKYETIYKPRGRKQTLNQALQSLQTLQQKIQQKEAQEADFQSLVRQADELQKQVSKQEAANHEAQQQQLQLEQQRLNWNNYAEYQTLKDADLSQQGSPEELAQLQEFYQEYQQLNKELEKLQQALQRHSGMDQHSAKYYFYLENEEKIQQLLEQKVAVLRLLDEEQRLTVQLAQQQADNFGWSATQAPQPFPDNATVTKFLTPLQQLQKQAEEQQIRLQLVQEQRDQAEKALNQYEKQHPELFNQPKRKPWWFVAAVIALVLAFFLPVPWRYGLVVLAAISAVLGLMKKNTTASKETWQEKLGQLDLYEGQLAELQTNFARLDKRRLQARQQVQQELQRRKLPLRETELDIQQVNQAALQFLTQQEEQSSWRTKQQEIHQQLLKQEQEFTFLQEWLPLQEKTITDKFTALEQYAKEMEQIRFAQTYQENTMLQQRMNEAKKQQQILLSVNQHLLQQLGLHYPSEVPAFLQRQQETAQKQQRLKDLEKTVAPLFPNSIDFDTIQDQLRILKEKQQTSQEALRQLQEQEQRLRLQIDQMQADGTLDAWYQQVSQQKAVVTQLLKEYAAAKLESQLLQDIATELSEQQLPELMKQASRYFQLLTDYDQARLDFAEGTVTVNQRPVYSLSTGTKDQVIMAIRFAYLALQKKHPWCPIIIDDGWLHYDHQRKRQLAKLFAEFSKDYQIICLSSDQEMVSYYQELHQPVWELKGDSR